MSRLIECQSILRSPLCSAINHQTGLLSRLEPALYSSPATSSPGGGGSQLLHTLLALRHTPARLNFPLQIKRRIQKTPRKRMPMGAREMVRRGQQPRQKIKRPGENWHFVAACMMQVRFDHTKGKIFRVSESRDFRVQRFGSTTTRNPRWESRRSGRTPERKAERASY